MTIHYQGHGVTLHHGDCLDVLRTLPDASVDSVVTDPPYGLEFMGKGWDAPWQEADVNADAGFHGGGISQTAGLPSFTGSSNPKCLNCKGTRRGRRDGTAKVAVCLCVDGGRFPNTRAVEMRAFGEWCEAWATECLRVLKPGGHLLAFGGTRTWHRLACAVEDAGFEVRDSIAWMYGSGFPKSLDVSKAIDKARTEDLQPAADVARWLVDKMEILGVTRRDICDHFEAENIAQQWTTHWIDGAVKPRVPRWEQWQELRRWLDLPDDVDAEVWRLNGRKGKPGDNFEGREVLSERVTEVKGGSWAEQVDSGRFRVGEKVIRETAPATDAAREWAGWGTALKPGHEPVVCARKPFNTVPLGEEVDRLHHLIGGLLWLSLSPAKRAELASPSSPAGQHGARCASALVSAATATSPDGFAQTGMCSSPATASTSSSIASSWSSILGALSALTSTSTTSTRSSTTTALTTLSSLLAPLTSPSTMPPCACLTSGSSSSAPSAGSDSTDEWARWLHTLSASVPETATEGIALAVASALAQVAESLSADLEVASSATPSATTGAAANGSPAFEPVVVARKPLIGTVAATVLAHGTGALNIDACRIGDGGGTTKGNPPKGESNGIYGNGINGACDIVDLGKGRWPANVVLDESQAEALDEQSGEAGGGTGRSTRGGGNGGDWNPTDRTEGAGQTVRGDGREVGYGDMGGASRFFFVASHDKGDTSALTGKGGRIESCETASTAAESSSPPRQFGDSALGGAVTSEHPDTASQTGSPSTSATPSGSRPSGRPATPTTQNIDAESSPEQQPGERTPTASPASSVGPSAPTVTTTTTTSPSTSAGSAAPATSDTTSQWKALGDTDSAPFKYVAKADATERPRVNGTAHPTVKPLSLMRWLVRLVTPPGGTVLEPFAGSGTTVEACIIEGFQCIAIEREADYLPLIRQRIDRRRDPVEALRGQAADLGLFDLLGGEGA